MRRCAVMLATLTVAASCAATSEADIEALVDERVETALADQVPATTTTTVAPLASLSYQRLGECVDLEIEVNERGNHWAELSDQGLAAFAADDLAEGRRFYRLQLAAFDDLVLADAKLVERCEKLALSEPEAAADWLEDRSDFAELVVSHDDLRAECRKIHDLLGMEIEDC